MTQLHEEILKNADIADEDFADIWEDMVHSAIKYSDTRAKWNYMTNEQKLDKDAARTIEHNIVIDNFIVLERVFKLSGWKNNSQTEKLFLQNDVSNRTRKDVTEHRKRIGDFSNFLAFIYAINGR